MIARIASAEAEAKAAEAERKYEWEAQGGSRMITSVRGEIIEIALASCRHEAAGWIQGDRPPCRLPIVHAAARRKRHG